MENSNLLLIHGIRDINGEFVVETFGSLRAHYSRLLFHCWNTDVSEKLPCCLPYTMKDALRVSVIAFSQLN